MKHNVDCPNCGGFTIVRNPIHGWFRCRNGHGPFTEEALLRHMRDKPGMDRNAPAFRVLDKVRGKAKSVAARAIMR